jgi:hypothetical protein
MMTSLIDQFYAGFSNRRLFFGEGWGDLPRLRKLRDAGVQRRPPREIEIHWGTPAERDGAVLQEGTFASPYIDMPLPEESRNACCELVLPRAASSTIPLCLHFAATGDEGFIRRRQALALPLLRDGIGSLILENPYYGVRRPAGQHRKMLARFSDLWTMGGAAVEEGRSLIQWFRQAGYTRLGVCGISMGGSTAAQVAVSTEEPLAMIGCLTAHSASAVFTEGILKQYLAWEVLNRELGNENGAIDLMGELLGITDIRRYPPPIRPEAAFLVAAKKDAYIPVSSARKVHDHWPGSSIQWLNTGHVGAYLCHRNKFRTAIRDAFARL